MSIRARYNLSNTNMRINIRNLNLMEKHIKTKKNLPPLTCIITAKLENGKKLNIKASILDLENRFRKIMKKVEEKYGVDLSDYSILKDIEKLIKIMRKYGLKEIRTDGYGEIVIDKRIPKDVIDEIEDLIYSIAWDIDCILIDDFVSDTNVVPIFYKIMLKNNNIIIYHDTVWDNA